ncbi:glycosyltransferase family 4 protein [Maribacter algicola]|uniref:Glycosyltransferase family 4 protein n=1 Tax=Meishania litoralis TaxID=3434685 RepID=A0ACC7LJC6_9FLAO
MSKRKIVFFGIKYFPSKGGTSRVAESLLKGLKDHFDITVYCYKNELAAENIPGVKTIQFSEIPIKGIGVFLYYLRCCIHLMVKGKYDLVHVHKTDAAFFLPILERKFKTVSTSHAIPYYDDKWSKFGKFYFRIAERFFMKAKGAVTSISRSQVKYYSGKYGRSVNFIPNGLDISKLDQVKNADSILEKHGVNANYLLFAARRIIPLKGCHTLIRALDQIKFNGTLVISGDEKQLPAYTQKLKNEASNLNVKFLGYVADQQILNGLIKGADFFIFPSEIEGMSMMLLEVAFNGTPLICSDIPQNTDVLSENEVLFFESKNVNDLAQKIEYAYKNREIMNERATKTKSKIKNEYDIGYAIGLYIDLYNDLIGQK